jgi:hypothetical protein
VSKGDMNKDCDDRLKKDAEQLCWLSECRCREQSHEVQIFFSVVREFASVRYNTQVLKMLNRHCVLMSVMQSCLRGARERGARVTSTTEAHRAVAKLCIQER